MEDPDYPERLKRVRSAIKAAGGKEEKRELSRRTRVEHALAWAYFGWVVEKTLENDSKIRLRSLLKKTAELKNKVGDSSLADEFQGALKEGADRTRKILCRIKNKAGHSKLGEDPSLWSEQERISVGAKAFELLTGELPIGEVEVMDTVFALGLLVHDEGDYSTVYGHEEGKKSGGFYESKRVVRLPIRLSRRKFSVVIPLIVAKDFGGVRKHEERHAIHHAIVDSLLERRSGLWRFRESYPDTKIQSGDELEKDFEKFTSVLFGRAKDELLADFSVTRDFRHLENLLDRDGIYDYISERVKRLQEKGLLEISDVEKKDIIEKVWGKYEKALKRSVRAVESVSKEYVERGLDFQVQLLPYVLAQYPLEEWESRFCSDFGPEVGEYRKSVLESYSLAGKLARTLARHGKVLKRGEREKIGAGLEKLERYRIRIDELANINPARSLVRVIEVESEELDAVKALAEEFV